MWSKTFIALYVISFRQLYLPVSSQLIFPYFPSFWSSFPFTHSTRLPPTVVRRCWVESADRGRYKSLSQQQLSVASRKHKRSVVALLQTSENVTHSLTAEMAALCWCCVRYNHHWQSKCNSGSAWESSWAEPPGWSTTWRLSSGHLFLRHSAE